MPQPRLSVIIPAYNTSAYLAEAVESVLMQQRSDLEIIMVNDASTDGTADVIRQLIQQHPDVVLRTETLPVNRGGGAARNRCVALAQGDYIFNLDADNILSPGLLTRLLDRAADHYARSGVHIMVAPQVIQYFRDRTTPAPGTVQRLAEKQIMQRWIMTKVDPAFVLTSGFSPASSGNYLYHRSIYDTVGGYFEDCGAWDTWSFGAHCCLAGFRFFVEPQTFYLHRLHGDSYWARNAQRPEKRIHFYTALRHFTGVYAGETYRQLDPGRADYPGDPFEKVTLDPAFSASLE